MPRPEVLAPAGSREALTAAVRCGADAVYFGSKILNARRNASNFTDEEVAEAIAYCHGHNVRVYITLNTLAGDSELNEARREIENLCLAGADAFIIQDLGIAAMLREICPSAHLHASTQMSVQSVDGLKILKELGFTRAVLPRELSGKEIKAISSQTDTELEYFVHGAHCMCLSGQCLMSSVLGGRSGNRGLCAQPCRLPFGVNGKGGNNLSLKDLSLVDRIPELIDAGISSLKIEGRMKRPEYVAAAVTACRNAIDGTPDRSINNALGAVFSRSGFTSGYFDGRLGKDMFGIRTKEDVEGAPAVLNTLSHLYDNENPLIPVKMSFSLKGGRPAVLTASACGFTAEAESAVVPSPALHRPVTAEDAEARLSKCGGTQFFVNDFTCDIDEGLNLPVSAINALRRDVLTALEEKIAHREKPEFNEISLEFPEHTAGKKELHLRFMSEEQIPGDIRADRVIVPLEASPETVKNLKEKGITVAVEIPVNVFGEGENYLKKLLELKNAGAALAWVCTLDGVNIARRAGMKFAGGFGMNIFNSVSLSELEKLGAEDCLLSCECSAQAISHMGGNLPRGMLVYGRLPLMVTRNCPVKNKISCAECGRNSELVDRMNVRFPVRCRNGSNFIFNSRPLCVYDKPAAFGAVDYDLLYFTTESPGECENIIGQYIGRSAPDYEYTRGLYFREVL